MAVFFAENKDNPGGLQKVVLDEEKLSNEEKKGLDKIKKEIGSYTTTEQQFKGDDSKIEVQGGNALISEIDKSTIDEQNDAVNVGGGKDKKESGFKSFVNSVGEALTNFADGAEKKLETVYDDREKRAMFLSGLNTVIEASSYTPITKAKSVVGTIASGQKKGFLESEAIGTKRAEIEAKNLLQQLKKIKMQIKRYLKCLK